MSTASALRRERARKRASSAAAATPRRRSTRRGPGVAARMRYAFDNSMARSPNALIWYLGAAVAFLVVAFAAVVLIFGAGPTHNPITAIYNVLLHTIDTGTLANDTGTTYTVLNLFVTFAGIFIFSAFIGVLANSIDLRLHELRKGRSRVLERDHSLILGWSESIFKVVSELAIANESRSRARIVILAERDKVEMEDELRERVPERHGTKVVCRTGSPIAIADLDLVNHHEARSVIVLAPESDDPDPAVIKTILALTRNGDRGDVPYHIVAEISDPRNLEVARLAGGEEAVILDKGLVVSRLIVQTSRQSGAAFVYQELLDFDGDEIYLRADPELEGRTYGETLLAYENCAVIGVRDSAGAVKLNPPMSRPLLAGEMVIAVAEDDAVLASAEPCAGEVDESAIASAARRPERPEATLILGYNQRTPAVLAELDEYAHPGARVELMATHRQDALDAAVRGLKRLAVTARAGDATDRGQLDELDVARFDRVIVMSDESAPDRARADARALVTLLHLRDIAKHNGAGFTIVTEILDEADRALASVAEVDDIVVSDQIMSYLLAQISENRDLAAIFAELLGAAGSEIYLRPVEEYVARDGPVTFATLIEAARRRDETCLGYRIATDAKRPDADFGFKVNPRKSERFAPAAGDRLVVLAEA